MRNRAFSRPFHPVVSCLRVSSGERTGTEGRPKAARPTGSAPPSAGHKWPPHEAATPGPTGPFAILKPCAT